MRLTDLIAFANQLSGLTLTTLLVVILYGSYKRKWFWGSQYTEMRTDLERRLAIAEENGARWQATALRALGFLEETVTIAKRKAPQDVA